MHSVPRRAALLLPFLALPLAGAGEAQSGREIMERALEEYESRMADVRQYTVTQHVDVMGSVTTTHFVKRMVDGHPVFVDTSRARPGGRGTPEGWGNPYRLFPQLADRVELRGRTELEGTPVWALRVTDFSGLDLRGMTPEQVPGEFRPRQLVLHVGTEDLAIRRLQMEGTVEREDGSRPIRMDARFADYRSVEGMLYPFRMEISIEGMSAVMSEEERRRARRQLRRIRSQLDSLDEEQRRMMEGALGSQIRQLQQIVETGSIDATVEVQGLRVNEPPPAAAGEGGAGDGSGG